MSSAQLAMSDLETRADVALSYLAQAVLKVVRRDAPELPAYAVAVWFEWSRGAGFAGYRCSQSCNNGAWTRVSGWASIGGPHSGTLGECPSTRGPIATR